MAKVRKRVWSNAKGEQTAWVADYFDQAGKRHIKTFETKREAAAWLVTTSGEVARGVHTPESASITVAEAAELWIEKGKLENLERSTLRQYRNHVDLHIKPSRIGNEKLARLSTPTIEAFCDDLLRKGSRPMARKVLASLKSILGEAQRRGLVAQNAAQPVKVDVKKRDQGKLAVGRDIPSKDEVQTILASAAGRWRPLFVTAIFTGMRASELRGLTWDDVDFERKVIDRASAGEPMGRDRFTEIGSRRARDPHVADGSQRAPRMAAGLPEGRRWHRLPERQRQRREPRQHRESRLLHAPADSGHGRFGRPAKIRAACAAAFLRFVGDRAWLFGEAGPGAARSFFHSDDL
jgi:integrase